MKFVRCSLQQSSHNPISLLRLFSCLSLHNKPPAADNPNLNLHPNPPLPQSPIKNPNPNNAHLLTSLSPHSNCLIGDRLVSSRQVLDKSPQQDLNSRSHNPLGDFIRILSSGLGPDRFDYGNVLSACSMSQNIGFGVQICSLVMKNGFFSNGYVVTGLIDLFSKSGMFDDALRVFDENCSGNVVCWNAIIAGAVRNAKCLVALDLFRRMVGGFCMPNAFTLSSILSACAASGEWEIGRAIHGWVLKCEIKGDVFVGTGIVDLYAKCGDMGDAVKEFSRMPDHNVVSWTAMISGFVQKEDAGNAVEVFKEMIGSNVEVNKYTLTSVLLACSKSFMVKETMQIHCWTLKNGLLFMDPVIKEAFINTYGKVGKLQMSDKIFEDMGLAKSLDTWSAMMSGLVQNESLTGSVELFKRMFHEGLKPDKKCTSIVLSIVDSIELGRQIHSYVVKAGSLLDVHLSCALFTMYSKCGSVEDSYELFAQMEERDRVSWTSMVSGFAVHGHATKAFQIFREMVLEGISPDQTSLSAALFACHDPKFLMVGKETHAHAIRNGLGRETAVGSALVSMYCKCNDLASARRVFDGICSKDQATWSSLVSGYFTNGHNEAALSEFQHMVISGFELDHILSSSVLGACANLSKPMLGRQLHAHGIKGGLMCHLSVSSALVTMYAKCGSMANSQKVFDEMDHPDLVTWTALIDGYAQHGRGSDALDIFHRMKRNGVRPDSVACLTILSACNHSGLVEEGLAHFNSMRSDYGIEPGQHHYASVVDLLGRSGRLKEAVNFIDRMTIEPDWLVWSTLLASCRVHGDVELGRLAFKKVVELEPRDSAAYVSAANFSAEMGDWDEVVRIRSSMEGLGTKKEPGWSLV